MRSRNSLLISLLTLMAALFVAPGASAAAAGEEVAAKGSGAQCAGPCATVVFGKGSGSGTIELVTVSKSGETQVTGCSLPASGQCVEDVEEGFILQRAFLRVTPDPGSQFLGWEECPGSTSDGNCELPLGYPYLICATFRLVGGATPPATPCPPPSVIVYKKGDGSTGNGQGTVTIQGPTGAPEVCGPLCLSKVTTRWGGGQQITVTAVPESGSTFVRWDGCGSGSTSTSCTFTHPTSGAASVCAVFMKVGFAAPASTACPYVSAPVTPPPPPPPPPPVDKTPPNTRITAGPSATRATRSRIATLRFVSTEARSTFICQVDNKGWLPCRSPKVIRRLKLGVHTFRVRAIDRAGNIDRTPAVRRWRIRA